MALANFASYRSVWMNGFGRTMTVSRRRDRTRIRDALGSATGDFEHAEHLARHIVSLPIAPHLTDTDIARVVTACQNYNPGSR